MKEQLELSLEQSEEGLNPISQGMDGPGVTLSLGAFSLLQQIAAWLSSHEQPEDAQAMNITGSAVKDVFSCW